MSEEKKDEVKPRTGWPPGMLQDDSRDLSNWLSLRGCIRELVRERCEEIKKEKKDE